MKMAKPKMFDEWIKERDAAALSFDVKKFRKFALKWQALGYYHIKRLPPDDVLEITMRKMVVNMENPPKDKYEDAKCWLLSRGYDLRIF